MGWVAIRAHKSRKEQAAKKIVSMTIKNRLLTVICEKQHDMPPAFQAKSSKASRAHKVGQRRTKTNGE